MQLHKDNSSKLLQMREAAFESASIAIRDAKTRHAAARQHRAISRITVEPYLLAEAIILPILFCGILLLAEPYLMTFWRDTIIFWLSQMDIPLQAQQHAMTIGGLHFEWINAYNPSTMPDFAMKLISAVVTFLLFALTTKMSSKLLPLKYLLRILCTVQTVALVFFTYLPSQFPYSIPDHMRDLINMGYMLILAIPVLLSIGFYLLHFPLVSKVTNSLAILGYFIVMTPFKVVLHTVALYHLSLLYMPLLYICFGAVFDVLIFVALYSFVVSRLPEQATQ